MSRPRFSIVVPTRQRPHTLHYTLATILNQDHDSFEVIVADNASSSETRAVVEAINSPKIRYVRSDSPLTIAANWIRGLAATRGEWITYLGDDDGLMPSALRDVDAIIATHAVESIGYYPGLYAWPCADDTGEANLLQLLISDNVQVMAARDALSAMMQTPGSWSIPMLYHGWISRTLLNRAAAAGDIFVGNYPDTFAGILLAAHTDCFVTVEAPLSISGYSATSGSMRWLQTSHGKETKDEVHSMPSAEVVPGHPSVPDALSVPGIILDGLLLVRDRLGDSGYDFRPTRLEIALHCLRGVWLLDEVGQSRVARIRETLETVSDREVFDQQVDKHPRRTSPRTWFIGPPGLYGKWLVCDAKALGARNVAEACTAAAGARRCGTLMAAAAAAAEAAEAARAAQPVPIPVTPPSPVIRFARKWRRTLAKRAETIRSLMAG
ncbi:MAG: glycosyltransferase family 2 protein [Planctomycetes bacterium]|nr:glycosyltransferase family 2 protein [Planctomycetota bacterium]